MLGASRQSRDLEDYVISICLNNSEALNYIYSQLSFDRDFTGPNHKAMQVFEKEYLSDGEIDPLVIGEKWVALDIYDEGTVRYLMTAYDQDTDYEKKVQALRRLGVFRQAQRDIYDLNKLIQSDIDPHDLTTAAMDKVLSWSHGSGKKYKDSETVERETEEGVKGERLYQGVPLLDSTLYKYGGQRKGQVKATVFREKHGKTRHACWEVAMDLLMGWRVLYCTTEGRSQEVIDNLKEILQDQWPRVKDGLKHLDGVTDTAEICTAIREFAFNGGDKVVVDHIQRLQLSTVSARDRVAQADMSCMMLTDHAVRYDLNMHLLNQANQPDKHIRGWNFVPDVYDCYGSNQLIKDAYIILVGFRPMTRKELIVDNPLAEFGKKVKGPDGDPVPLNSVFVKPILSRKKMPHLHMYMHFLDTDEGYKVHSQEMI